MLKQRIYELKNNVKGVENDKNDLFDKWLISPFASFFSLQSTSQRLHFSKNYRINKSNICFGTVTPHEAPSRHTEMK